MGTDAWGRTHGDGHTGTGTQRQVHGDGCTGTGAEGQVCGDGCTEMGPRRWADRAEGQGRRDVRERTNRQRPTGMH